MHPLPRFILVGLLAAVCGCTGIDGLPSSNVLVPNETLNISKSLSLSFESIAAGAAIYLIVDPLAPNWQIEQSKLGEDRYRIALRKKRFNTGGDGEVMPAFYRRAEQLVRDNGAARYRVIEFTEAIDSGFVAQRVAQGVVELQH